MESQRLSFTEQEVASLTGIKVKTLQRWRVVGQGPPWIRAGSRLIRYPAKNLTAWLENRPGGGESAEAR